MPSAVIDPTYLWIAVALYCLAIIPALPSIIDTMPVAAGCLLSWKESLSLSGSPSLRHIRNIAALSLTPAFILLVWQYALYPPASACGERTLHGLLVCTGAVAGYALVHLLCRLVFRRKKTAAADYACAAQMNLTFFFFCCSLMLLSWGVCSLCSVDCETMREIFLWEIGGVFALLLMRKLHFFSLRENFFKGFLYLCTLEFLPAGLLIASAVVF